MLDWVKEHPYLTGTAIIGVVILYFVLRGSTSDSQAVQSYTSGPSDAQLQATYANNQLLAAAQAQQNELNAALTAKNIESQTLIEIARENTKTVTAQGQSQLEQVLAQVSGETQVAGIQTGGAVDIAAITAGMNKEVAGINVGGSVQIAGIQAGVSKAQIEAELRAQEIISGTAVAINAQNTTRDISKFAWEYKGLENTNLTQKDIADILASKEVSLGGLNLQAIFDKNQTERYLADVGLIALKDTNAAALTLGLNTNQTTLDIASLRAGVESLYINTEGQVLLNQTNKQADVWNNYINTQGQVDLTKINAGYDLNKTALEMLAGGVFNKGGEGGAHQVAVISAMLGAGQVGVAAEQGATANSLYNSPFAIVTGIGNAIGKIGDVFKP